MKPGQVNKQKKMTNKKTLWFLKPKRFNVRNLLHMLVITNVNA